MDEVKITEVEDLFNQMGEDYHLWDKEEQGEYPIERVFDAMKNFIKYFKNKEDEIR